MLDLNQKLDIGVGNLDPVKLQAKKVVITNVDIKQHDFGGKPADQLVVMVTHPDKPEQFQIYNIIYRKGNTLKKVGCTIYYDIEGKLMKETAIVALITKTGVLTLRGLIGKTVDTELDESGFLVLKAY